MRDKSTCRTGQKHLGLHIPNGRVDFFKRLQSLGFQCIAFLGQKQALDFVVAHSFRADQTANAVDDADDVRTGLGEVQRCSCADVAPALNHHFFARHAGPRQLVVVTHRLAHAVSRDQVGHANLSLDVRADGGVFHRLRHPLAEVANAAHFLGFVGLKVPREDAFLRVPHAVGFRHGNDLVDLVDVEVASRSVVVLQKRRHRLVPTFEDAFFPRICRIEIDAAFGTPNVRARDGELHLHGFRQTLHLALIKPFSHPRAAAGRTASQGIDDHPSTGFRFAVLPRKHNFWCAVFVGFQ